MLIKPPNFARRKCKCRMARRKVKKEDNNKPPLVTSRHNIQSSRRQTSFVHPRWADFRELSRGLNHDVTLLHSEFYEKCVGHRCTRGNPAFRSRVVVFPVREIHSTRRWSWETTKLVRLDAHVRPPVATDSSFSLFFSIRWRLTMLSNQFGFALVFFLLSTFLSVRHSLSKLWHFK